MKKVFLALLLVLVITPVAAKPKTPPQYTISHPRVVLQKERRLVQIKWYQDGAFLPKTVVGVKLTNFRYAALPECGAEWDKYGYAYCYVIYHKVIDTDGYITVLDRKWRRGDQYMTAQYEGAPTNSPYGPFIPK